MWRLPLSRPTRLPAVVQSLLSDATEQRVPVVLGALGVTDVASYGADAFLAFLAVLRPDAIIANRDEHASLGLEPDAPVEGPAITIITDGERPTPGS